MSLSGAGGRGALAVLLVLLASACGAPPSPYAGEPVPANPRRSAVGGEVRQLAELDGWWMLLAEADAGPVCLAVRPAIGTAPPTISGGHGVSGEGGFYMAFPRWVAVPFFGFYGAQPFGDSRAELDGERIRYTDDRDTVLGWEGRQVAFQVWTDPALAPSTDNLVGGRRIGFAGQGTPTPTTRELDENAELITGEVDFSGVTRAYEALLDCHAS